MMNCPHCGKTVMVKLSKDDGKDTPAKKSEAASGSLGDLLESINMDSLEEYESKFVTETKERFEKYGASTRLSPKQQSWLESLAAK